MNDTTFMTLALRVLFGTATEREQERLCNAMVKDRRHLVEFSQMSAGFIKIVQRARERRYRWN